jgi:hypothetical protein
MSGRAEAATSASTADMGRPPVADVAAVDLSVGESWMASIVQTVLDGPLLAGLVATAVVIVGVWVSGWFGSWSAARRARAWDAREVGWTGTAPVEALAHDPAAVLGVARLADPAATLSAVGLFAAVQEGLRGVIWDRAEADAGWGRRLGARVPLWWRPGVGRLKSLFGPVRAAAAVVERTGRRLLRLREQAARAARLDAARARHAAALERWRAAGLAPGQGGRLVEVGHVGGGRQPGVLAFATAGVALVAAAVAVRLAVRRTPATLRGPPTGAARRAFAARLGKAERAFAAARDEELVLRQRRRC